MPAKASTQEQLNTHTQVCAERYQGINRRFALLFVSLGAIATAMVIGWLWMADKLIYIIERLPV